MFGFIISLLDGAVTSFIGALQFDITAFEDYFPAAVEFNSVIRGFAVGLLFIMLIFQLFRNFGIMLNDEVEAPLPMLGKTALFFGMITYSRSIIRFIIKLLVDPYSIFLNTYTANYEFDIMELVDNIIGGANTSTIMSMVYLIMLLMLGWQLLKFVVEVVERYVVFYFILYCAPVVFATGSFKSTSQIFKSWCRMLGSQAMLLLLNIWSVKLFTSFMMEFNFSVDSIILHFLMGYGFLKFAQKADTLLRILGLNTASTGSVVSSLGSTIGGIAQVMRTMGGAMARRGGGSGGSKGLNASNGHGNPGNKDNAVSGMNPFNRGDSSSGNTSNLQSTSTNAAAHYANAVLSSAKGQMKNAGVSANSDVTKAASGAGGKQSSTVQSIDAETREGLDNLARGLPHDEYNADTRKHSGGGFAEFTGENANIIGASQLTPKAGVSQKAIKMPDGSNGTMYEDSNTGKSHLVQFGSVDNGVVQGCISEMNPETGKPGDAMAFKAVHESVPGAEIFSTHAIPISDGSGGNYHIASGADMSFLQDGITKPNASNQVASAVSTSDMSHAGPMTSTNNIATAEQSVSGIAVQSSLSQADISSPAPGGENPISVSLQPSSPGNTEPNAAHRFSRNNPANMEVFKRQSGTTETFTHSQENTENISNPMKREENPYEKKK